MIVFDNPKTVFHQRYGVEVTGKMGKRKIEYIGEWRKGIAIGYSKDPMSHEYVAHLITKDKELLYCGDGYPYMEDIYRTSKGYYVVTAYHDVSAPEKDSDYRGPFLNCIISEDGKEIIHHSKVKYGHFKNDWYDSDDTSVFTPKEMGEGIVENDNTFYRLDDFKKLFDIPKKYVIESVYEQGLCLLSVPENNRDFIVTVKAKEVVDFFDVNDTDKLFELIDRTNCTSLIEFCSNEEIPAIRAFRKQQKEIEEQREKNKTERLSKVNYYSAFTYPTHYISEKTVSIEEFMDGITISEDEIRILNELHEMVCREGKEKDSRKYTFHLRENPQSPDNCLECLFYSDFMMLRMKGGNCGLDKMYRFYSLQGESLSAKIFNNLQSTKNNTKIEEDKNFNNHKFHYSNGGKDGGIVIVDNKELIDNPFPEFMFDKERYGFYNLKVNEDFISFKGNYYDFFYNKIALKYVHVKIEEVIKNYLYKRIPKFYSYMLAYKDVDGKVFFDYHAKEKYVNGEMLLPIPRELDAMESELHYRNKNLPNHIEEVIHIGDFEAADEGGFSLYLFKCRPHGYCDTQGNVFYDFDPDKVLL